MSRCAAPRGAAHRKRRRASARYNAALCCVAMSQLQRIRFDRIWGSCLIRCSSFRRSVVIGKNMGRGVGTDLEGSVLVSSTDPSVA
jgi:hypothetical protein